MYYIFLAVLSSSSMTLILKYSEVRKQNRYAVTPLKDIMVSLVLTLTITLSSAPLPPVHPRQFF